MLLRAPAARIGPVTLALSLCAARGHRFLSRPHQSCFIRQIVNDSAPARSGEGAGECRAIAFLDM